MKKLLIFGAKSIALGICLAIRELYRDVEVIGFLVSNKADNPDTLAGLPVYELKRFRRKDICILIAAPEDVQDEIVCSLKEQGFYNYICINSQKESELMEKYYFKRNIFPSIHSLQI